MSLAFALKAAINGSTQQCITVGRAAIPSPKGMHDTLAELPNDVADERCAHVALAQCFRALSQSSEVKGLPGPVS